MWLGQRALVRRGPSREDVPKVSEVQDTGFSTPAQRNSISLFNETTHLGSLV